MQKSTGMQKFPEYKRAGMQKSPGWKRAGMQKGRDAKGPGSKKAGMQKSPGLLEWLGSEHFFLEKFNIPALFYVRNKLNLKL